VPGRGRKWPVILGVFAVLLLLQGAATAKICKWMDRNGTLWFVTCRAHRPVKQERILRAPGRKDVPPGIDALIQKVAREEGMDPDLVRAVVGVESDFNPSALSPSGAMGLMQLMPKTAALYGVENPWDPYQNLKAGTRYLKHLLNRFNNDLELALAAYNAGPTTVKNYGGVPPYSSTKRYISKVMQRYPSTTTKTEQKSKTILAKKEHRVRRVVLSDGSVLYTNLP